MPTQSLTFEERQALIETKVQHTRPDMVCLPLWGINPSLLNQDGAVRYDGQVWKIELCDNKGDDHVDYVAADSAEQALDKLAEYGYRYSLDRTQARPNLSRICVNQNFIDRYGLEPDELIPLGAYGRLHVHSMILKISSLYGWEMPSHVLFIMVP